MSSRGHLHQPSLHTLDSCSFCALEATGKGIGSALMRWADQEAIAAGCDFITLQVVGANEGAIRLYERKGYVHTGPDGDCCDQCAASIFVFCCLGCRYCSVHTMRKALKT